MYVFVSSFFFFFFPPFLQNIVNNAKIFKAPFIDRIYFFFLRVIYDDFSSFKCHTLSHTCHCIYLHSTYRSICMYAVRLTIVLNMTLSELLRVFSSHLACAHGRFKWRSFGAGEKIQTNRDVAWFWAGQQERHAKLVLFDWTSSYRHRLMIL